MNYNLTGRHISAQFNEELAQIRNQLLALGGLLEQQLHDAIDALQNQDIEQAQNVLNSSENILRMRDDIDEACTRVIIKRQPAGRDLRLIMAMIRMTAEILPFTHLIEKMVRPLLDNEKIVWTPLENLARLTEQMLHQVLDAFARMDAQDAKQWYDYDDHLDKVKKQLQVPIVAQMQQSPENIPFLLIQLRWARLLENIGDRCQSICTHILNYAQKSPK